MLFLAPSFSKDPVDPSSIQIVVGSIPLSSQDIILRSRLLAFLTNIDPVSLQDEATFKSLYHQSEKLLVNETIQKQALASFGSLPEEHIQKFACALGQVENQADLEAKLFSYGIPLSFFYDFVETYLKWRNYIEEKYQSVFSHIPQETQERVLSFKAEEPLFYMAEIFLPVNSLQEEQSQYNSCIKIISLLKEGADFFKIAALFSQSATSSQGGMIGWVSLKDVDTSIRDLLPGFPLEQVTGPWRTTKGWSIVLVLHKDQPQGPFFKKQISQALRERHFETLTAEELNTLKRRILIRRSS